MNIKLLPLAVAVAGCFSFSTMAAEVLVDGQLPTTSGDFYLSSNVTLVGNGEKLIENSTVALNGYTLTVKSSETGNWYNGLIHNTTVSGKGSVILEQNGRNNAIGYLGNTSITADAIKVTSANGSAAWINGGNTITLNGNDTGEITLHSKNAGHGIYANQGFVNISNFETLTIKSDYVDDDGYGISNQSADISITKGGTVTISAAKRGAFASFTDTTSEGSNTTIDVKDLTFDATITGQTEARKMSVIYMSAGKADLTAANELKATVNQGSQADAYAVGMFGGELNMTANTMNIMGNVVVDTGTATLKAQTLSITGDLLSKTDDGVLKVGANTTITGKVNGYTGLFEQVSGTTYVTDATGYFGGNVAITGGAINVEGLTLSTDTLAKTTLNGGAIEGLTGQFFTQSLTTGTEEDAGEFTGHGLTLTSGKLVFNDEKFNMTYVEDAQSLINDNITLVFNGTLTSLDGLVDETTGEASLEKVENLGANTQLTNTTVNAGLQEGGTLQIGTATPSAGEDAPQKTRDESLNVSAVNLDKGDKVTVTTGQELTLVGSSDTNKEVLKTEAATVTVTLKDQAKLNVGGEGTQGADLNKVTVKLEDATMNIAGDHTAEEKKSFEVKEVAVGTGSSLNVAQKADATIATVTLTDNAKMNVSEKAEATVGKIETAVSTIIHVKEEAKATIETITGQGTIKVGHVGEKPEESSAGSVTIKTLTSNYAGTIMADPAWKEDGTIADASTVEVTGVDGELNAKVVAGQNSLIALGGSVADAQAAFEKTGMKWAQDGVNAAVFIGQPITLGTNGGVTVDGTLTFDNTSTTAAPSKVTNKQVTITSGGMLMVDQTAMNGKTVISNGTLVMEDKSNLSIVNPTEGALKLADTETIGTDITVVTNNPWFQAAFGTDGQLVTSRTNDGALVALSAAGMQQTMRRADTMLATSIADRTSFDQELAHGLNVWVDATAERYDTDGAAEGAGFKSDIGYGAFGADIALTKDVTAGAALQYGKGSLRGEGSIKNDVDNYGVALYGTWKMGDAKLVGDVAYLEGRNEITATQDAMNGEVDTSILSAGLRVQYRMTSENFEFVPSIGVRVSKLKTDAMKMGQEKIEDQDQTLVQVPVALRINGNTQNIGAGWNVMPSFKIAYVPTFGDEEIAVQNAKIDVIDTNPVQGEMGLRFAKDNMMINVNMMVGGGDNGSSALGGKVGFKYAF